jgi:hypothetical protein
MKLYFMTDLIVSIWYSRCWCCFLYTWSSSAMLDFDLN